MIPGILLILEGHNLIKMDIISYHLLLNSIVLR